MATNEQPTAQTVVVPAEALQALLDGWAQMTAHIDRESTPLDADDAYDLLRDLAVDSANGAAWARTVIRYTDA